MLIAMRAHERQTDRARDLPLHWLAKERQRELTLPELCSGKLIL